MLLSALPAFVLLPPVPNKSWGHLRIWMSLLCLGHATAGSALPLQGSPWLQLPQSPLVTR